MNILIDFQDNIAQLSQSKIWEKKLKKIKKENLYLNKLIKENNLSIYGANTLPGHKDNNTLTEKDFEKYHKDFINSHTIDIGYDHYSKDIVRNITYAKLYSISAGMTGVSVELFNILRNISIDPNFYPKIPKYSSYSSGDVIPAAHWVKGVLLHTNNEYILKPGEAMALINGNYIQVGYGISLIEKLKFSFIFFIKLSTISNAISKANITNLYLSNSHKNKLLEKVIKYIKSEFVNTNKEIQDPVSIRANIQVIDLFCQTITEYLEELNNLLISPSGNPLYNTNFDRPLSQASFLAPNLSIRVGSLIEAILFTMWSIIGRTNHLLSGNVEKISQDATNENSNLALIQYPKIMTSILEKSRLNFSNRIFSSGSSTSYGIEDLWSNGLPVLNQLDNILNDFITLCFCELKIFKYLKNNLNINELSNYEILNSDKHIENTENIKLYLKTHKINKLFYF